MARFNQLAGRTPENWHRRYDQRRQQMERIAELLGGTLKTSHAGGPGVPDCMQNKFEVVLADGTVLSRRAAKRRAADLAD